ncbi:unnamed protein product [Phaedon cochleariae]|uniref:Double jelly roll-like domain-containing protein n=1 Tax=Phaedon cochleariae TaxID=80249 RepID=A0A9N9SG32_PHACE|nr:unnamed protein product [Phaedon cochleariae]
METRSKTAKARSENLKRIAIMDKAKSINTERDAAGDKISAISSSRHERSDGRQSERNSAAKSIRSSHANSNYRRKMIEAQVRADEQMAKVLSKQLEMEKQMIENRLALEKARLNEEYDLGVGDLHQFEDDTSCSVDSKVKVREWLQDIDESVKNVTVIDILISRYGRADLIVKSLVNKAKHFPVMKNNDFRSLTHFAEDVSNLVVTLEIMDMRNYLECPQLLEEILQKLPYNMQLSWGEKVLNANGRSSLREFKEWIWRKSEAASYAQSMNVVERANTALQGSPQTQSIAKITIESINLKVPHLTPNDDIKLQLLTRIKADESMMIPFRRFELHELPALTQGSTIEIWSVKTCSALDSPRYVIVFFQTKKADNLHEDVTLFDNANIKSIRLALNSDYYPQERMLLDFSRDQYADAYFNYTEFNKSYHNCQEKRSLVNFAEFKSRPMFVIDCSRRHLGNSVSFNSSKELM